MEKLPTIKKMLRRNKKVDAKKLAEGLSMSEELFKLGGPRARPKLASPLFKKRVYLLSK